MKKLLLVFALIAIVACADLNKDLDKLLDEIKLNGVDWNTVWDYVKRVGCAVGAPACCAIYAPACGICNAVVAALCG